MAYTKHEIRAGAYYDSVVLMQLQKALAGLPGMIDAGVVMATPANRDLLLATGFDLSGMDAKADDLLIVVKAESEADAASAIGQVDELLKRRRSTTAQDFQPRSLKGAVSNLPDAQWVLISVPGRYAAGVAEEALDLGKHVFLYSDNVSLEDEIRLKQKARDNGLLLMGPDCGTAIINGVGLGFANRVRKGDIGIVAASGTGLQAVSAAIHNLGGGISQAIGTGGRDLKRDVGGICAQQGLDLLGRDPQTRVIVLISKPPDAAVVTQLVQVARAIEKPTVICFIGYPPPAQKLGNLYFATNLSEAASLAIDIEMMERVHKSVREQDLDPVEPSYLRGLFSGGTLAYEALLGLQTILSPIYSNIPIRQEQQLADSLVSQAHTILDLGEDAFTQGRLHPMMDNDLRLRRLREETEDPAVGLIMLDVVLGEGAHPDPASELAPAVAEAKKERDIEFVAIVLGTDEDPQDVSGQIEQMEGAGAIVYRNTTDAVIHAGEMLREQHIALQTPIPFDHIGDELVAINVGVESFYDSLKSQGASAIQVDWRPPAGGNEQMMAILAKMRKK